MLEYDIMAIGNHELYSYDVAKVVYEQAKRLYVCPLMRTLQNSKEQM
jgi:2',3'-cyclic-nucleotide 2'-phosphodiesterase (5'-nucleotidase family)